MEQVNSHYLIQKLLSLEVRLLKLSKDFFYNYNYPLPISRKND